MSPVGIMGIICVRFIELRYFPSISALPSVFVIMNVC